MDKGLNTIKKIMLMMDARLKHIEDISADNRAVIVKLVKQSNQIVKFLKRLELDDITDEFEDMFTADRYSSFPPTEANRTNKVKEIKELIDEFMVKHKEIRELEKELIKHRKDITPGEVGES